MKNFFPVIASKARALGREAAKYLLTLWFVLKDGDLTSSEKTLVIAALAYVLVPADLIPRRIFHLLGITDDFLAIVYVVRTVQNKITPQIMQKVEMQLDKWFGCRITAA